MFLADTYLIQNKIYFFTVAGVAQRAKKNGLAPCFGAKNRRVPLLAAQLIVV